MNPKIDARGTSKETSCTANSSPNFFVKCLALMTASSSGVNGGWLGAAGDASAIFVSPFMFEIFTRSAYTQKDAARTGRDHMRDDQRWSAGPPHPLPDCLTAD